MLRPATPLTILLFVSFILLLLSVISTPIVKGIPIATFKGVNFGVFGYCKGSACSGIKIGYDTDGLFGNDANAQAFDLPSGSRHTLSSLLVVHPVAAFLNLICFALAAASHLHSPSHSQRFLLGLLILLLPTLLVTLLAFLVDILLFVPHLQWGGWLVLVSTILVLASGIITCAMRRTLVTRKARKKRIAENAEMSGENYYSRQNTEPKYAEPSLRNAEPMTPMVNGAPGADKLPKFSTYDSGVRHSDDERRPLNQLNGMSNAPSTTIVESRDIGNDRYGPPRSRSHGRYDGARDEFGNPLPSSQAFGPPPQAADGGPSPSNNQMDRMPLPGRGSYGSARGRGGYPPRGGYGPRGGYSGPRGPAPPGSFGRGGFPGEGRGGYGPRGRGGFGMGGVAAAGAAGIAAGAAMRRPERGPPPTYPPQDGNLQVDQFDAQNTDFQRTPYTGYGARQQSPPGGPRSHSVPYQPRPPSPGAGLRNQSPHSMRQPSSAGRFRGAESPPPLPTGAGAINSVGQAIELDGSSGRPIGAPTGYGAPVHQLEGHDSDVQGMVGLQQNRGTYAANRRDLQSPTSAYSPQEYVPPRQNWTRSSSAIPGAPTGRLAHDQVTVEPVELPTANSAVGSYRAPSRPRVHSGGSDVYYEDVDPRFAAASDPAPVQQRGAPLPGSLAPGPAHGMHDVPLARTGSYEDLPGARSPAESETSNFTSVSQRGVNPNWRPGGPGDTAGQFPPNVMRRPMQAQVQERRDLLLGNNPDFELPIPRPGRGRGGSVGMGGGTISRVAAPMSTFSAHGARYPGTEV